MGVGYYNCNAGRCIGSPDIVHSGEGQEVASGGQSCYLAELEVWLRGCGLWSLLPYKVTGSQRGMRCLKGGALLSSDRLLCPQVALAT